MKTGNYKRRCAGVLSSRVFIMKTEIILCLDCRKDGNIEKISRFLRKIKLISKNTKDGEIPSFDLLNDVFLKICSRYNYNTQGMKPYFENGKFIFYQSSLTHRGKDDNGMLLVSWIGTVEATTIWELYAKMIIKMYADIKEKEGEREE